MSLFLIDLGRPVIFVHIPKTGGTSIRRGRMLSGYRLYEPDPEWHGLERAETAPEATKTRTVHPGVDRVLAGHPSDQLEPPLPVFGFVRDPFDRAESAWRDFRFIRPQTTLGFEQWLQAMAGSPPEVIDSPVTGAHHAAPMTHPVHGLQHAEFIGNHAYLQRDFDSFCEQLGVERIVLPRHRYGGSVPRAPRDVSARRLIEDLYADDYEYLEALHGTGVAL